VVGEFDRRQRRKATVNFDQAADEGQGFIECAVERLDDLPTRSPTPPRTPARKAGVLDLRRRLSSIACGA
jgi:hypothetical protein